MEPLRIELSLQDADIIMKALVKLPYEVVSAIIPNLDKQIRSQLEAHE